jgi:hypothetical protein
MSKPIMDRKNINRCFKKIRVWQDATALYDFDHYSVIPVFHHSRWAGIKLVSLKATYLKCVIEVPRHYKPDSIDN